METPAPAEKDDAARFVDARAQLFVHVCLPLVSVCTGDPPDRSPYGFAGGLPSRPSARGEEPIHLKKTRRLSRRCRPLPRKRIARARAASLLPLCIDGENDGAFIGAVSDKGCAFAGNAKKICHLCEIAYPFLCRTAVIRRTALRQIAAAARFAANHKSMSLYKFSSHLTHAKAIRQDNPP